MGTNFRVYISIGFGFWTLGFNWLPHSLISNLNWFFWTLDLVLLRTLGLWSFWIFGFGFLDFGLFGFSGFFGLGFFRHWIVIRQINQLTIQT